MSKRSNRNYVSYDKFETLCTELGDAVTCQEQAGNLKVMPKGRNDVRLYVAKQKHVGRVHIAGFVPGEQAGVKVFTENQRMGSVFAELDFSATEEELLTAFKSVLTQMLATAPKTEKQVKTAKKERAQKAAGAPRASKKGTQESAPAEELLNDEERQRRLDLIRKVAAAKGVEVSASTESALTSNGS